MWDILRKAFVVPANEINPKEKKIDKKWNYQYEEKGTKNNDNLRYRI